jgi:hypothetical protein
MRKIDLFMAMAYSFIFITDLIINYQNLTPAPILTDPP